MRIAFVSTVALAATMLVAGAAKADPAEMADLEARIATMEAKLMAPAGGGGAESLTSMGGDGTVRIGGGLKVEVNHVMYDRAPTDNQAGDDDINWTDWAIDPELEFRIDASPDTYVYFELEFDGDDDTVDAEEAVFVWDNVRGSGWTLSFGRTGVPFGQFKYEHRGLVDGESDLVAMAGIGANTFVGTYVDETNATADEWGMQHLGVEDFDGDGTYAGLDETAGVQAPAGYNERAVLTGDVWQTSVDEVMTLGAEYTYQEMVTFEVATFGNNPTLDGDDSMNHGFFESYALRLSAEPMDGLDLSLSFISQEDDTFNDGANEQANDDWGDGIDVSNSALAANGMARAINEDLASWVNNSAAANLATLRTDLGAGTPADHWTWDEFANGTAGASNGYFVETQREEHVHALSAAFDYVTPDARFNVYGEYIHTWNAGNFDEIDTDSISLGLVYAVNNRINLIGEFAWVGIDNEALAFEHPNGNDTIPLHFEEDIYQTNLAATYALDSGVEFLAGWTHEWMDEDDLRGWDDASADRFEFECSYSF
jgi:hypothetical protein